MRPIGPGRADAHRGLAALDLGRRRVGEIRPVAFAGVDDQHAGCARGHRARRGSGSTAAASSETSLPSASPKPPGSRKSRCMSMMTSADRADVDLKRIRLGLDPDWHSIPRSRRRELRKFGAKSALLYAKDLHGARRANPLI